MSDTGICVEDMADSSRRADDADRVLSFEVRSNRSGKSDPCRLSCCATFQGYPKTPRLFRDIVVTEKIDGTNAAVGVTEDGVVYAQSRKRIITPGDDNFGFARWVHENADYLMAILGPGLHFGEWWGSGIQRGYGLSKGEKQFSLFNTKRWEDAELPLVPGLDIVPVLYEGVFDQAVIESCVRTLREIGSYASPGFKPAEGVVIYHAAANHTFKVLLENDDQPKGQVA